MKFSVLLGGDEFVIGSYEKGKKGGKFSRSKKTIGVRELCNLQSSINYEKCIKNEGGKGVLDIL